jgi:hypothetical protein
VRALIVAVINPDNTPHGYNWTYAFPMLLFIVIALVLWALFGRPHQRVPARPLAPGLSSRTAASTGGAVSGAHLTASAEAEHKTGATDEGSEQPPDGSAGAGQ